MENEGISRLQVDKFLLITNENNEMNYVSRLASKWQKKRKELLKRF